MRVATWNVNSVKARLAHLCDYLSTSAPDVLLLQEIKCQDADFPRLEVEAAGYRVAVRGQKSYNGVAILSRHPIEVTADTLPGDPSDEQARYLE
ncbi:MAG: endonuclease/exonuclease/phosphatase family protein, partial [Alphaproteobacteria bacterium]